MAIYRVRNISDHDFSIYQAVYSQENIFMSYDWTERMELAAPKGCGYLLLKDKTPVGGAVYREGHITSPFIIPPFNDKKEFWQELLQIWKRPENSLYFDFIPYSCCEFLEKAGARKLRGQSRMMRPTAREKTVLDKDFYFTEPVVADQEEIIEAVYEAHLHGYTSTVTGQPDRKEVGEAVRRRFDAFSRTGTLHFGTIVKNAVSHRIAAVCLAGIYPDSRNCFSTIHQVSVLPQYRRKGLAEAMMRNTINTAHSQSPVITLGVMTGNPAKRLYSKVGFISGMEYNDYVL